MPVRYLRRAMGETRDGYPRLLAAVALTFAGLCLADQTRLLRTAAKRLADELARRWESDDRNPLVDAAARALREEQQRRDDEAKAALALARRQAQRGPVDWYRLFPEDEAGGSSSAAASGRGPKTGVSPDDLVASIHTMHLSFPERRDDDSASTMINNPRAPLRVSVRGKGELMGLVASRTAAQYQHVKSDPRPRLLLNPF
jgi:hypothetical protein